MDPSQLTLVQTQSMLRARQISARELAIAFLDRIDRINPDINAFITVDREGALRAAQQADERLHQGNATPMTGIPIGVKDLFCTENLRTTCGSKMLSRFIPPYESTVTRKLKEAGAVILGKTNMDEFAMGSSNETSWFGPVKNPWDPQRIPGGSSGGSAAALAAGLALATIGTDTGGSIRQPAALTGITGLKPTYGRVSRYGMIAFASSLDQAGPMARSAEDAAVVLQCIAGHDAQDSTSIRADVPDYAKTLYPRMDAIRIGIPTEYRPDNLLPEIQQALEKAEQIFRDLGAVLVPVSLPHTRYAIPTYYIIAPAEASSNLARYDGIRFGYRCQDPVDLKDLYTRTRTEGFGDEVKRRIMLGTYVLSSGYYDAYYRKAQKVRRLIANDFHEAFKSVDLLLTPTTPTTAFPLGDKIDDPVAMYLSDLFTINVNLAGLPGISIPCGTDAQGLPIGMQLIAPILKEENLLSAAHAFQTATTWHQRKPEL
ncbi:MAG: aspartyl/glutamyl-tRNA(Asn/Gln) amidotransferase subunit A [Magnetococcales bacterium]|nr:aspartyl/glutamyl-tRNA(Asn/Gln) amidotransferase subunit A [Magnetococcales bacterium]HIJ84308.1 Asp-tRNA(Asn)/Glu-tRNA(Gln) amidotransferase subunit GatA [Magnetococcales bacterium]